MSVTELPTTAQDETRPARGRTVLMLAAAMTVFAVAATWVVAFSSVFGARSIQVRSAQTLSPDLVTAIRSAARIAHGTPLIRLDTDAVRARVEQLPDVASAQVDTSFPSTVVITVQERTPVGYVTAAGRIALVDRTGRQYHQVLLAPANLPRLVPATGTSARSTAVALAQVAAALPRRILRQVRSIEALDPNAITLVLSGGRIVDWGTSSRTTDKARLLPVLMRTQPTQIDLSNPDQPFTR